MTTGRVYATGKPPVTGKPRLNIAVANPSTPATTLTVAVTVDTGFTGYLTLTPETIEELDLTPIGERQAVLADGALIQVKTYATLAFWQGKPVIAPAFSSRSEPLLGMALLWGNQLTVDAHADGAVTIREIPSEAV